MKTVNLIVEGTKDVYFLHEFLLRRFPVFARSNNPIPSNRLEGNVIDLHSSDGALVIRVKGLKGFADIAHLKNLTLPSPETEGSFGYGIIFDADDSGDGNHGGFKDRLPFLLNLMKTPDESRKRISESIFLFPNNKDDGDLEVLMEKMVAPSSEHDTFLKVCWKNFSECVNRHGFNRTTQKSKMNEYTAAFFADTWGDNGINRSIAEPSLWNWNSHSLDALYRFIERMINN